MILCLILWLLALRPKRTKNWNFLASRFAHRGLHSEHIPENSLSAFALAVRKGFGAELDVHLTKSGELVVFHDRTLKRMTGAQGLTEDLTPEARKTLRLKDTDECIPLLQEVLPLFEGKTPLLIELKTENGNHKQLTRRVCELLVNYPQLKFCIQSFDPRPLRWLKKHRPDIIRGQLTYHSTMNLSMNFLTRPHFVACKFTDRKAIAMRICRRLWGVREIFWTIKDAEDAKIALDSGASIIFDGEV